MAARTGRWLFLPLALVLLLYIRDLLGQAHGGGGDVVEGAWLLRVCCGNASSCVGRCLCVRVFVYESCGGCCGIL